MGLNRFLLGFASCLALVGCTGAASFPFKHYWIKAKSFEGKLEGDKPENDRNLEECKPREGDQNPCTVSFTKDYLQLKFEYEDQQNRIMELERQLQQCARKGN